MSKIWIYALFEESYDEKFLPRGKLSLFPALIVTPQCKTHLLFSIIGFCKRPRPKYSQILTFGAWVIPLAVLLWKPRRECSPSGPSTRITRIDDIHATDEL